MHTYLFSKVFSSLLLDILLLLSLLRLKVEVSPFLSRTYFLRMFRSKLYEGKERKHFWLLSILKLSITLVAEWILTFKQCFVRCPPSLHGKGPKGAQKGIWYCDETNSEFDGKFFSKNIIFLLNSHVHAHLHSMLTDRTFKSILNMYHVYAITLKELPG